MTQILGHKFDWKDVGCGKTLFHMGVRSAGVKNNEHLLAQLRCLYGWLRANDVRVDCKHVYELSGQGVEFCTICNKVRY